MEAAGRQLGGHELRRPADRGTSGVGADRGGAVRDPVRRARLLGDGGLLSGDGDRLVRRPDRPPHGAHLAARLAARPGRRQAARGRDADRAPRPARVPGLDGGGDRRPRAARERPASGRCGARGRDRRAGPGQAEDVVAGRRGGRRRARCSRRLAAGGRGVGTAAGDRAKLKRGSRAVAAAVGGLAAAGVWGTRVSWWALLVALVLTWISGLDYARAAPRLLRGRAVVSP